jgi:hypothetical protein
MIGGFPLSSSGLCFILCMGMGETFFHG